MENSNQTNNSPQQTATSTHSHKALKPMLKRGGTLWRCLTSFDVSYINKYKPKMLSSIAISNLHSVKLGLNGLRNLRKALTDTKRVSSLHFNHLNINSKQLIFLLDSTNHWKRLEFFDLQDNERMNKELIKTLPRLARYKNLYNSPFPRSMKQGINREIAHGFWRQLRKIHHLGELKLETPLFRYPKATLLTYRPPKSLLSLHLDFKHKDTFNSKQLAIFISSLSQSRLLLQDLTLIFFKDFHIGPLDAQLWTFFFQNSSSHLKKIKIDFTFSTAQQPEGVKKFMESFKYLKNLATFDLSFELQLFTAWAPSILDCLSLSLFTSLQCLNYLETLTLKAFTYHEIKTNHIDHLNSTLQHLKNLKKLELNLPYPQSPDETLVSIGNSLEQFTHLKTLDIALNTAHLSCQSVETFSKNISHLHLTSLNLTLGSSENQPNTEKPILDYSTIKSSFRRLLGISQSKETPPSLIPFFSNMSQFKLLSTLKLGVSAFQISSQELQNLSLALKQLNNLLYLHLILGQFDSNKNFEGLRSLLSCFPDLSKLSHLHLVFESDISNQEIGFLSSYLVGCQSLHFLTLDFKKAEQLKDESLAYLLVGIRGLLNLQELLFVFQRNERFGEKIVAQFLEGLTTLKNLSTFFFLYDQMSMFHSNNSPLPLNLKGYEKLRYMTYFIVDKSSFL